MVEYGGKGEERSLCTIERDRSEEAKAMKNRLMWEACLPPGDIVLSGPGLWPSAMSGLVILLKSWSVPMPMAPATTEGHKDTWDGGF